MALLGENASDPLEGIAGLDEAHRTGLLAAARGVRAFPNRLDQILATRRLRVGTTGDYAPFTERSAADGNVNGIDVDLARDLAAALGVAAEFVPTTWPTLEADLAAGRYDIAMSGVSRTLARQRAGFLSGPYHADGKTPIGRCADRAQHASLAAIDRSEVRVVVNPGGTNERFVDERVAHAKKIVHPDNRTIFTELLEDRADVMFTDRIEVELQTRLHPELCALMAENLTYQEKAYLLPRDPVWLEYVDTWLALRIAEGKVDAVFAAHQATRRPPR
jgi:cyclohexadienyl dehydratase